MPISRYTLQKIGLSLSILIVFNLLLNYSIQTFYREPKYEDFCKEAMRKEYKNQQECEAVGGVWQQDIYYPKPVTLTPTPEEAQPRFYCNATVTCQKEFDEARNLYTRNVFIILVIAGAAAIAIGFFTTAVSAVSSGFLFGGLISIFIGTVRYWSDMADYLRLGVLVLVLAFLVWLGYKKLKDKEKTA